MCPYNFLNIEVDSFFSSITILIIILELFILNLQGCYGAYFFLPGRWKKTVFDYYKTYEELIKMNIDLNAVIFKTFKIRVLVLYA
jgi:hypothetical protein